MIVAICVIVSDGENKEKATLTVETSVPLDYSSIGSLSSLLADLIGRLSEGDEPDDSL